MLFLVKRYLSQLAALELLAFHLRDSGFADAIHDYLTLTNRSNTKFNVDAKRTGPAFNFKIEKKKIGSCEKFCVGKGSEAESTVFDADFTLALICPNFPKYGRCKLKSVQFYAFTKPNLI